MKEISSVFAGRRLLVVEDEYFIAEDIKQDFETAGAEVVGPVASVEGAMDLLAVGSRIDGAVLDVNLRDTMVFPVADALVARGIPFVFATGYDAMRIPQRFKAISRCQKPIDPLLIAQALSASLELVR